MAVNNVNIQTFNCEVNDEHRKHIEEKVGNLERLWPKVEEAQIRITEVRGRFVTEITLVSGGLITRGEERSGNLRGAFDTALGKLEKQLRRHKDREITRRARNGKENSIPLASLEMAQADAGRDEASHENHEDRDNVVRVKRFALKPMSPEEAVLQMDLLGHNFFVFRDAENNQVSVVYKREHGGYGLIEPVAD
ncbi:MAG TPA: ribosome-associated translation inhibitor RaiA [Abditibacteriaceae bacterium]|jgi:putative sigma-54 modulation protein